MSVHVITGGCGFVAATLIGRLLLGGHSVLALDDLSRGRLAYVEKYRSDSRFAVEQLDCNDIAAFEAAAARAGKVDHVWHLAANSDIPAGVADPRIDLERTFMTTFNTLLVMQARSIPNLHFASSSAVYGDLGETEIGEDAGPMLPISNYGAMKLASEAQIRAAVESWLTRADVFRFPNVVGVPATHGVILDLINKLKATPDVLEVLGDGSQQKPYLHVEELVEAMLFILDRADDRYNVFNIGPKDTGVRVSRIAETVRDRVAPQARIAYGSENRGWIGDVPKFRYSVAKLAALGWTAQLGSEGAIRRAVDQIALQEA